MKNDRIKLSAIYALIVIAFLTIILPIYFCVGGFSCHWIIFGVIALLIPYGVIHFALNITLNKNLSQKEKQQISIKTILLILFYWLADCFYMAMFNNWLLWIYVIGIVVLAIILVNLAKTFINDTGYKYFLIFDLIIGICLTVCLIYCIPDRFNNLQTIVTTIVAAVYGGLLTLVGVAWTIKHSDKQKREDELAKAKPMFTFNIVAEKDIKAHKQKICLINDSKTPQSLIEAMQLPQGVVSYVEIENSDNSTFLIKKLYFDSCWHSVSANNIVLPNNKLIVQLFRKDLFEHAIMEVEDIYNRKFYYDLHFLCIPPLPKVEFCTLIELTEITLQELKSRNISLD